VCGVHSHNERAPLSHEMATLGTRRSALGFIFIMNVHPSRTKWPLWSASECVCGPVRAVFIFIINFRSWLLLAAPGCCWLFLAAPGCAWPLLTATGCSWLLLAAPGCSWLLLAAPGCSWQLLAVPGRSLLLLAATVRVWTTPSAASRAKVYVVFKLPEER
jgi:hypothetical protein